MISSPSPDDRQDPYADRRASPRVTVALPAFLQVAGARHAVQLLDLSAGGAKLDCPMDFPVGTAVTLDCGTLVGPAVVRWQNGRFVGVSFESELAARDITALVNRSNALAALRRSRE